MHGRMISAVTDSLESMQVYAFSVESGRVLGSYVAHDDAVSCIALAHQGAADMDLVTASWDCSVKLWR